MAWTSKLYGATATDHLAEHCRDELCPRLPCRMYKAGYWAGYEDGRIRGQAEAKPEVIYVHVNG